MSNRYASAQLVNLSCTFTVSGHVTDPTTVRCLIRFNTASAVAYTYPTAAPADANLVRDSSGVYHCNVTAVSAGTYYYRFEGWTACQAAAEGSFDVLTSHF